MREASSSRTVTTLYGVKVAETTENLSPGVYVIRQGSETKKIVVK